MGLLEQYNQRFASRLELLKTNMEKVVADAHRQIDEFNNEFVEIYNELHGTLHGGGAEPPTRPKNDPDAEAKARIDRLPTVDLEKFEQAIGLGLRAG